MRAQVAVAVLVLPLAGCLGSGGPAPADTETSQSTVDPEVEGLLRDLQPDAAQDSVRRVTIEGRTVLSFPQAGLFEVRLEAWRDFEWAPGERQGPYPSPDPTQPPEGPQWALLVRQAPSLAEIPCAGMADETSAWGLGSPDGSAAWTGSPLPATAGAYALFVHIDKRGRLDLVFDTGDPGENGATISQPSHSLRVTRLQPDPRVDSEVSPFRVSFEHRFDARGPSFVFGYFEDGNNPYVAPRRIETSIAPDGGDPCLEASQAFDPAQWGVGGAVGPRVGGPGSPNEWTSIRHAVSLAGWVRTGSFVWSGSMEAEATMPPAQARTGPLFGDLLERTA